LDEETKTV